MDVDIGRKIVDHLDWLGILVVQLSVGVHRRVVDLLERIFGGENVLHAELFGFFWKLKELEQLDVEHSTDDLELFVLRVEVVGGMADLHDQLLGHEGLGNLALDLEFFEVDRPRTELRLLGRVDPDAIADVAFTEVDFKEL